VLKRAFAPAVDMTSAQGQRALWQIAEALLPRTGRATWTHNQALMELGALVCTARVAHCDRCPVRPACRSAPKPARGRSVRSTAPLKATTLKQAN
jgi:A/G-specific adenine glycosylase